MMKKFALGIVSILLFVGVARGAEIDNLRARMRSIVDETQGTRWFYDKTTPVNPPRNALSLFLSLGQRGGHAWPSFTVGFSGKGKIFFEALVFSIDGERIVVPVDLDRVVRDSDYANVWESITMPGEEWLIKKIYGSKDASVRFDSGMGYYVDFAVSRQQKDALRRVWRLYELMSH
ncbi:MAG: hypothetical protein LBQ42_07830 [Synergistaceae bacterium]|jgi:hypothetical protein|nr:hypothetical protein [Synergistaceae bacterium]